MDGYVEYPLPECQQQCHGASWRLYKRIISLESFPVEMMKTNEVCSLICKWSTIKSISVKIYHHHHCYKNCIVCFFKDILLVCVKKMCVRKCIIYKQPILKKKIVEKAVKFIYLNTFFSLGILKIHYLNTS